jgi:hypothetical protein
MSASAGSRANQRQRLSHAVVSLEPAIVTGRTDYVCSLKVVLVLRVRKNTRHGRPASPARLRRRPPSLAAAPVPSGSLPPWRAALRSMVWTCRAGVMRGSRNGALAQRLGFAPGWDRSQASRASRQIPDNWSWEWRRIAAIRPGTTLTLSPEVGGTAHDVGPSIQPEPLVRPEALWP